ncbi:hypothetical protein DICSQDRAFT_140464 [Dichomitus squalens LYAD-421 SS1]|uniref:Uncharacterized protein n=1 Tax=Dichomitus squalens (strain LYAD-421) TaxID=732165 RepID=R7SMD2_DICSQ|nr:uncharacterized protein DICSQDRAFT_140464 [Dichomitus squalens LYAD-421 SS1]EJF57319.1 hypothetical protein DICSQDRAFT_140464 [Dichomitus squalens LYAD-421 SS1]
MMSTTRQSGFAFLGYVQDKIAMIHPAFADINRGSGERRRLPPRPRIAFRSGRQYLHIAEDAWFLCGMGATMGAACIA